MTSAREGIPADLVSQLPESVWQLPLPLLLIALLSLGIFVTRREHKNMTNLMEYFKGLADKREVTIQTQAESISENKEVATLLKDLLETIRKLAKEGRE